MMADIDVWFQLDSNDFSIEEKGSAILHVLNLETHNGFSRKDIARAIEWIVLNVINFTSFKPIAPYHAKSIVIADNLDDYTENVRFSAIMTVLLHRGYTGITKDALLRVLRYCWEQCFEATTE